VAAFLSEVGYKRKNTEIEPDTHLYVRAKPSYSTASSLRARVESA